MRLENGEELILELVLDKKNLFTWFFSKTLGALMFSLLMTTFALFVFNTFDIVDLGHSEKLTMPNELADSHVLDSVHKRPFQLFIDYWCWNIVIAIVVAAISQVYYIYLRKTYAYFITNKRCVFIGGILNRSEHSVFFKKLLTCNERKNFFERILKIWNVKIFTPGTGSMAIGLGQRGI